MGSELAGHDGRQDDEIQLRELRDALWRHRALIAAAAAAGLLVGALVTALATPLYEATTSIRIDEKQSSLPALDALKSLSEGSQVSTELTVLQSRTLAEDVIDSLGLRLVLEKPRRTPRRECNRGALPRRRPRARPRRPQRARRPVHGAAHRSPARGGGEDRRLPARAARHALAAALAGGGHA